MSIKKSDTVQLGDTVQLSKRDEDYPGHFGTVSWVTRNPSGRIVAEIALDLGNGLTGLIRFDDEFEVLK